MFESPKASYSRLRIFSDILLELFLSDCLGASYLANILDHSGYRADLDFSDVSLLLYYIFLFFISLETHVLGFFNGHHRFCQEPGTLS